MPISAVGSLQSAATTGASGGTVRSTTVGNILILSVQITTTSITVDSVSGGGVGAWSRLAGPYTGYDGSDCEFWWGKVTSPGSNTMSITYAITDDDKSISNTYIELDVQEFTAGLGANTVWTKDVEGARSNPTSSVITYPSLTPAAAGELYWAHGWSNVAAQAGNASGVTYLINAARDIDIYSVRSSTAAFGTTSPLVSSSPTAALAVLVRASGGTSTVSASGALSGASALTAAAVVASAAAPVAMSAASSLTAAAGVGAPPAPPEPVPPAPEAGSGGPVRGFPSVAGYALYKELGPLTAGDAARGYPLLRFVDAIAGQNLQDIDDLVRDTEDGPGWSQAMDPSRAPTAALAWLGQFAGVAVDTSATDPDQRAQVTGLTGFARGTVAAIKAAAEAHLAPGQHAAIAERAGGDPYAISVTIPSAGIKKRDYADLAVSYPTYNALASAFTTYNDFAPATDQIVADINKVKPAGLVLTVILA